MSVIRENIRYCPRCGEKGETVVAPDNHEPTRSGGHFYCSHCGYECDRDVVGALNVARKHFGQCQMEETNPVAYTETGNHASFPYTSVGSIVPVLLAFSP
jgi:NADH pyrophosphatase NudC (nudix superfamily)